MIAIYCIMSVLLTIAFALPCVHFIYKSSALRQLAEKEKEIQLRDARLASKDTELKMSETLRQNEKDLYEKTLKELKDSQEQIIKATKNELAIQNEKMLKEQQEALNKRAEETMKVITGGLDKDIKDMKEAFDAQKKTHTQESSAIKTQFEETVKNLKAQTDAIGTQAVDLANALKGKNKMQGIFGETILENILQAEGLRKGHDYDTEFWLRDRKGEIIENEQTGKKMRPDFALHFPDSTDVIIDSKVSLTALADYFEAADEAARKEASRRNLQSVLDHVKELTDKEYQKFVQGRRTLDYVIMFIPNYGAYQLAKQEDPEIFSKAFAQNVLITTEETLIPFLRLIRSAWVQKEQMENMAQIVSGAQKMVDRVSIFCKEQASIEKTLEASLDKLKDNGKRLIEGRQSIVSAAQEVIGCGVKLSPGKELPSVN